MTRSLTELDQRGERLLNERLIVRRNLAKHAQRSLRRAAQQIEESHRRRHNVHLRARWSLTTEKILHMYHGYGMLIYANHL